MKILKQLMDLIYPPRCPVCGTFLEEDQVPGGHADLRLCEPCFMAFSEIRSPFCPICRRPFGDGIQENHVCEDCLRKRPFFEAVGAPYLYEGRLMEAIHLFKYGGKTHLADSMGILLTSFAGRWLKRRDRLLMMPIPLHPKRLRERGFNQSLLLARHVASRMGMELDYLSLRRVRYTLPQAGLKSEERRKNVRKAFELRDPGAVKGRTVILVDDVATTGSTLNECARILRRAGAEKVLCLVLARTVGYQA